MEQFALSWLDKLLKEDIAIRDSGTMGWRYEDGKRVGFVYGNTLYQRTAGVPLIGLGRQRLPLTGTCRSARRKYGCTACQAVDRPQAAGAGHHHLRSDSPPR